MSDVSIESYIYYGSGEICCCTISVRRLGFEKLENGTQTSDDLETHYTVALCTMHSMRELPYCNVHIYTYVSIHIITKVNKFKD